MSGLGLSLLVSAHARASHILRHYRRAHRTHAAYTRHRSWFTFALSLSTGGSHPLRQRFTSCEVAGGSAAPSSYKLSSQWGLPHLTTMFSSDIAPSVSRVRSADLYPSHTSMPTGPQQAGYDTYLHPDRSVQVHCLFRAIDRVASLVDTFHRPIQWPQRSRRLIWRKSPHLHTRLQCLMAHRVAAYLR